MQFVQCDQRGQSVATALIVPVAGEAIYIVERFFYTVQME